MSIENSNEKFATLEEVDQYLSGNKIQCLICGRLYLRLQYRHLDTHGLTADGYRERFGIPWRRSLTSKPSREKTSARMTPERLEQFRMASLMRTGESRPRRPNAPAVRAEWKKNAVSGRVLAFRPAVAPCIDCGAAIHTTALAATQPMHCEACATPEQLKARHYAAKLKLRAAQLRAA